MERMRDSGFVRHQHQQDFVLSLNPRFDGKGKRKGSELVKKWYQHQEGELGLWTWPEIVSASASVGGLWAESALPI